METVTPAVVDIIRLKGSRRWGSCHCTIVASLVDCDITCSVDGADAGSVGAQWGCSGVDLPLRQLLTFGIVLVHYAVAGVQINFSAT